MNANNLFNGMFGKIAPGMCRLSMNGGIAVKTSNGYKTYNMKTGRLTNQDNFALDIGEDFFFVIPTNKVTVGDIILVAGSPKCVIEAEKNKITVIDYEGGEIKTILPERHVFMGNTYFYGKIVSMFGSSFKGKNGGLNNIMKYMMMSEMFKGNNGSGGNFSSMLPFMMMSGGGFDNMFDGMFDMGFEDDDDAADGTEEKAEEE